MNSELLRHLEALLLLLSNVPFIRNDQSSVVGPRFHKLLNSDVLVWHLYVSRNDRDHIAVRTANGGVEHRCLLPNILKEVLLVVPINPAVCIEGKRIEISRFHRLDVRYSSLEHIKDVLPSN